MDREYVIPAPKLTDIVMPALGTGQAAWVDKLWNLKETKGVIKVMHLCDIHFPFQHNGALNIAYQLVEMVQPDVIVDGSDIGDFAMLSAFDPDPDVEDEEVDTLDDFEALYAPHENILTMRGRNHPIFIPITGKSEIRFGIDPAVIVWRLLGGYNLHHKDTRRRSTMSQKKATQKEPETTPKTVEYYMSLPYQILLTPLSEDGHIQWYAEIPVLGGMMVDGATIAEAIAALEYVKGEFVTWMLEDGDHIPEPAEFP